MTTHSYLGHVAVFCIIFERGSLRGASRVLDIPVTTLKRRLDELEHLLGTALFVRDHRNPRPTLEGTALYESSGPLVMALLEAVNETRRTDRRRRTIRIGAPLGIACSMLLPFLSEYLARHGSLCIDLCLTDASVDRADNALDLLLVEGTPPDGADIAHPLARLPRRLVAAPDFVTRRGMPTTLNELRRFDSVTQRDQPKAWWFRVGHRETQVRVESRLTVASAVAVAEAVRAGAGLGLLPAYLADPAIASGTLIEVPMDASPRPESLIALHGSALCADSVVQRLLRELSASIAAQMDASSQRC